MNRRSARLGHWPVVAVWLTLPLLTGPVLASVLDDTSRPVQVVASVGLWTGWAVVLLATLVPRTVSLTLLRIAAPAASAAVMAAAVAADGEATGWRIAALVTALVVVGVSFTPSVGQAFVNGSAYGDEERFCLRVPGLLLMGPVEAVWLAVVAGVVAGPLLLAAHQWVLGAVTLVAGGCAVGWGARVLHTLARRWVVLVPGGLVLHDQLALTDPVLLRRSEVAGFGPAPAGTDALDLTRGALGLALEVQLKDATPLGVVGARRGEPAGTADAERLLITPTRPGALLRAARARRVG